MFHDVSFCEDSLRLHRVLFWNRGSSRRRKGLPSRSETNDNVGDIVLKSGATYAPAQRVLGAKIDGPRYKWNGVYNQYLGGGICTPLSRACEEMRGE